MTFSIKLVNMPFAALSIPSIALAQLKAVTMSAFPGKVAVETCYLNHDFGRLLGLLPYELISSGMAGHVSGLGEWLFRRVAFPEQPDNKAEYIARYAHNFGDSDSHGILTICEELRDQLDQVLDEVIEKYQLAHADVVGFTSMFLQNLASIAVARRLRRLNPKQIIVLGGANCESTMGIELVANVPVIDFVFSGQSLVSFPQFIGSLLQGDLAACHRIDGVFSRNNSRSIVNVPGDMADVNWGKIKAQAQLNGVASLGRELDINAPVPLDYDDFLHSFHRHFPDHEEKLMVMFETSRGCWWGERAHCTFCGLNSGTMSYRAMSPERAIDLIQGLISRYGDRVKSFQCVDNILPKEYLEKVFPKLNVPESISIFYEVKSDLTNADLGVLARARVMKIQPGIEALATSTLKLMKKGMTASKNIGFLAQCKAHGIAPAWNLLIGFPGETADVYATYAKILPTLFHLPPPTGVFPVRFDRFSPYFNLQREYGLRLAPYDYYGLTYPFPAAALMNMAYYFQDLNVDAPYARDAANWLARLRELVSRWRRAWADPDHPPMLEYSSSSSEAYVWDTRTGARRRHLLLADELALLKLLVTPVAEEQLSAEYQRVIGSLRRKGLLFSERGKIMSIVAGLDVDRMESGTANAESAA